MRAEFGHPDVAVALTCLSYYNGGLDNALLRTCFELLYKLDNPELEYEQWVAVDVSIPDQFRSLQAINLMDFDEFKNKITPTFSRNRAVINFYLSSVVFPRESKEFPHKLSTSGWDLAERKAKLTTGFSGTNDNRYLLPNSIFQEFPSKQSSTNALVLTHLLRKENDKYTCIPDSNGQNSTALEFLKLLAEDPEDIRVLLDVGAQMLELQNDELVREWLCLRRDVKAAVYFDENDELVVLPRDGQATPFSSSPFSEQMDKCIVYLDDGHTRGTDLKLPTHTRAAVTLGSNITKDRLVQGQCRVSLITMRL